MSEPADTYFKRDAGLAEAWRSDDGPRQEDAESERQAESPSVVGFSGTGKTPGLNVTMRTLAAIERDRKGKIAELKRAHDLLAETAKAAAKKWRKEVDAAVQDGRKGPEKPPEAIDPGEFIGPRLAVTEATIERLPVLLQVRPSGLAAIYDELAGLFLNMSRYSNGSDREFWLKAWNGQRHVVERQGRPAVEIEHLLVGVTGGFQPDKLAASFKGDCDGMYARMLFAWPDEPVYRELSNDVAEIEPDFYNALTRLVGLAKVEDGHLVKHAVDLSAEAVAVFEQFRKSSDRARRALDGREREWFAKGPGQVLRLAGTLCWLDWAMANQPEEPTQIDAAYVTSAIHIWRKYFLPHARAALRQIGLTDHHANARRVSGGHALSVAPHCPERRLGGRRWRNISMPSRRKSSSTPWSASAGFARSGRRKVARVGRRDAGR